MALGINIILAAIASIIAIGFIADLFFQKTKIPDMLWLMIIGVLLGPAAVKIIWRSVSGYSIYYTP